MITDDNIAALNLVDSTTEWIMDKKIPLILVIIIIALILLHFWAKEERRERNDWEYGMFHDEFCSGRSEAECRYLFAITYESGTPDRALDY